VSESLVAEVERWLDRLFIAAEGATLRQEDRRKAIEVAAMLDEIRMAADRLSRRSPLVLVDAAAGKSYVGLLAARLVLEPAGRTARVITIESDPDRVQSSRRAADCLGSTVPVECRLGDVADAASWPEQPSIVAALHACGPASDAVIEHGVRSHAKALLIVPCCTSKAVAASARAIEAAGRLHIPHQAPVRRRFIQAWVDAERTRALEAAGYETEVVEFVAATVTPHNLLWRARRVLANDRLK
jgi:precorrin-6B methylase 2